MTSWRLRTGTWVLDLDLALRIPKQDTTALGLGGRKGLKFLGSMFGPITLLVYHSLAETVYVMLVP